MTKISLALKLLLQYLHQFNVVRLSQLEEKTTHKIQDLLCEDRHTLMTRPIKTAQLPSYMAQDLISKKKLSTLQLYKVDII